jgi:pyruvate/2-oxoglutarate dehydrogenase complex dihydrolipoamide dehydrogenase (E3) component
MKVRATTILDGNTRIEARESHDPDYLVLATGSSYPFPAKTEEPDIASARIRFRDAHEALLAAGRVLIVGAGPSGLELAGEIKAFYPDKQVTIVDSADDILAGSYDQALRDELHRQLANKQAGVVAGHAPSHAGRDRDSCGDRRASNPRVIEGAAAVPSPGDAICDEKAEFRRWFTVPKRVVSSDSASL